MDQTTRRQTPEPGLRQSKRIIKTASTSHWSPITTTTDGFHIANSMGIIGKHNNVPTPKSMLKFNLDMNLKGDKSHFACYLL